MSNRPLNDAAMSGQRSYSSTDYSAGYNAEAARAEAERASRKADEIASGQRRIRNELEEMKNSEWLRTGENMATEDRMDMIEKKLRHALSRIQEVERKSAFEIAQINTILDHTLELCNNMMRSQSIMAQNFLQMREDFTRCLQALGLEESAELSIAVLPEKDFADLISGKSKVFMLEDVTSIHQMGDEYDAKMAGYERTWKTMGFDFARSTGIPWIGKEPGLSRHVLADDDWKKYPETKRDEISDYLCFFRHLFTTDEFKKYLTGEGFRWIDEWRKMEKELMPVRAGWNLSLLGAAREFAGKKSLIFKALHGEPWTSMRRATGTGEVYKNNMGKACEDMKDLTKHHYTPQELWDAVQWDQWNFIQSCEDDPEWQTGRRYEFTKETKELFIKLMTKNEEPIHAPHF